LTGDVTVADVVAAGARVGSPDGHALLVDRWARSVWRAWAPQHAATASLTDQLLREHSGSR
jgi:hypothetical protein